MLIIPAMFLFAGCSTKDNIDIRISDGYVQWSYEGENNWVNIISVDDIKETLGESYKGEVGTSGKEIELRKQGGYLQWRYVGESTWKSLAGDMYTISFDCQGGWPSIDAITNIPENTKVEKPTDPTRDGYLFDGWYYQNEKWSFVGYTVSENMTLTARWNPIFKLKNNTILSITPYASTLKTLNIPSTIDGVEITEIGSSAFLGCNSMKSISFPNTLETIESNAFENCESLEKISLPNSLHKIGANAFKNCTGLKNVEFNNSGWWLTSDSDYIFEKNIDTSNSLNNAQNLLTNEISKTWSCYELYSINYHLNNGQLSENAPHYFSKYTTVNLVEATKKGYTFDGYYSNSNFTSQKVEKIEKGTTSFEVYAKWNLIAYKIEYNLKGGTNNNKNPTTYNVEMNNFQLLKPTKDHYDFVGWYDDSDHLVETINTQQCKNISLMAKFTPITYTISYELNGGTNNNSNPTTYTIETQTIILQPATFENEKVSRWHSEQAFETRITTIPKGSHGNIKLYARAGYEDDDLFKIQNKIITGRNTSFLNEFDISIKGITKIVIPNNVTGISKGALSEFSSLKELTIPFVGGSPSENTYLGYIFGADSSSRNSSYVPKTLEKIIITGGTSIGVAAFYDCSSLTSIIIPDSVRSIGDSAFRDCSSLTSITIPNSVTRIGGLAFYRCRSLTSITIPNSVTSIDGRAFSGCSSLISITIPNSVTSIAGCAFENCISLTSITIPDSVTSIGGGAFSGCRSLTSITIPNSITNIDSGAFENCISLNFITIPDSVKSVGSDAFKICDALREVHISSLESWFKIDFVDTYSNPLCCAHHLYLNGIELTEIIIPSTITEIKDNVLHGACYVTSIAIPDSVRSIGDSAFRGCSSLTSITIPNSVTSIGNSAFYDCSSLTSITIPSSVTSIGDSAFRYCSSLTSISIPNSVTTIGNDAFAKCDKLKTERNLYDNAYYIGNATNPYLVLLSAKGKSAISFQINTNTKFIHSYAFSGCSSLTSIIIPDSVTSIGSSAFYYCSGLTSITIPDSVTSIGDYAFSGCRV